MPNIMKKSCYGCRALTLGAKELPQGGYEAEDTCFLGYKIKMNHRYPDSRPEPVPCEACPKPRTHKALRILYKELDEKTRQSRTKAQGVRPSS